MLHSFSLFRIVNMLENWHQMDGNWLETIKHIYSAHMRLLQFLWFSMKLGVINSFLIVCFTMVQKYLGQRNFTKFLTKISRNGDKTTFREKCITFTVYTRETFTIIFPWFRSTKQFMIIRQTRYRPITMVTIDKNLVSWTNMVLSGTCLRFYYEVRCVFKFFHKISDFKLIFTFKFQILLV